MVILFCLMSASHIDAASIYKTYDEQGNVVFTDQPVDEASAELLEPPAVNVADPLPVAPHTPPQLPETGTPLPLSKTPTAESLGAATAQPAPQTALPSAQPIPSGSVPAASVQQQALDVAPLSSAASGILPVTPADSQSATNATANGTDAASSADPEALNERVAIPVLPEGARPPVIGTARPSSETQVSIHWPEPDEIVLSTQSPIWIEFKSTPNSLKASGLHAEVWIDDKLAVSGERPLLPLVLPEVGLHKLQVRLVDGEGNSVAESDSQLMDVRLGATQNR